jgi:nicotinamidase-related amidase
VTRLTTDELRERLWLLLTKPYAPVLSRATTALICIDMQYQDAHPDFGLGARAKALGIADFLNEYWQRILGVVIPNVRRLQDSARRHGIEVIHVRVASITRDGRDNSRLYRIGRPATPTIHSKDAEFIPDVAPRGDEIVISKVTSSPFNSTNIDRVLRNLGIRDVIVVGVVTNGCIESTVRSAAELDYGVYLVEDATGAMAPQLHEYAVLSMGSKDAAIASTDDILRMFDSMTPEGPAKHADDRLESRR